MKAIFLVLLGFFITFPYAYADVMCNPSSNRCMTVNCKKVICLDGQISGYIDKTEKLKAIRVQVIDENYNIKLTETLQNPPNDLQYYTSVDSIRHDQWIFKQLIKKGHEDDLTILDKLQLTNRDSLVFKDDVVLYEDDAKTKRIGTLGEINTRLKGESSSQTNEKQKVNVICVYKKKPEVIQSSRCNNEKMCMASIECNVYNNQGQYNRQVIRDVTVMCRANGLQCPEPTACVLDTTKHFLDPVTAENADSLMEYDIDVYGGASHDRDPVQIEMPDPVGSGSVR